MASISRTFPSEGPSTQYLRFLVPNTMPVLVFGARNLKYWVLGPFGSFYEFGKFLQPALPGQGSKTPDSEPNEGCRRSLESTLSHTPGRIQKADPLWGSKIYTAGVLESRIGGSTCWILPGVWDMCKSIPYRPPPRNYD